MPKDKYKSNEKEIKKYKKCLADTKKRNDLSLCPEGYCTAKSKYKVYPSAYANGMAAQVCDAKKKTFIGTTVSSNNSEKKSNKKDNDLKRWFDEEWVNVCDKDKKGNYKPCGRDEAKLQANDYPYCRPLNKLKRTTVKTVDDLSKNDIKNMCGKKQSVKPGKDGKPVRVFIDKK